MNANESNEQVLTALQNTSTSPHVTVAYRLSNGGIKVIDMGYVTGNHGDKPTKKDIKMQFKFGCQRVNDNLITGHAGYVRDADGTIYQVSRESKTAKRMTA